MQRTHPPSPRRGGLWRWATLVAFVGALIAAQTATAPIAAATAVQVSPSSVEPGGTVEISGDGFAPGVPVRLCLGNERCTNLGIAPAPGGSFSTSATIPADTPPGGHAIHACQQNGPGGWACASDGVEVAPPEPTTTTTQPTTTTTRPTTTTTQPTTTTTRPRTTTTRPPETTTTASPRTTTTESPASTTTTSSPDQTPIGPSIDQSFRWNLASHTPSSRTSDTTTTTTEDEVLAWGTNPTSPPDGGATTPPRADGAPTEETRDGAGGGLFGLALHHWVLLVMAPVLGFTVIWLVNHFGTRGRRSRHVFLESTRDRGR